MIRGFACGVFDLYHPGHVLMLQECKKYCDHLTVALNTAEDFDQKINPGKRKPLFSVAERKMVLASVRFVDEVIEYNSEDRLTQIMREGDFQIRFLGDDYKGRPITAPDAIQKIHYLDRNHGYSTTSILDRIKERLNEN